MKENHVGSDNNNNKNRKKREGVIKYTGKDPVIKCWGEKKLTRKYSAKREKKEIDGILPSCSSKGQRKENVSGKRQMHALLVLKGEK